MDHLGMSMDENWNNRDLETFRNLLHKSISDDEQALTLNMKSESRIVRFVREQATILPIPLDPNRIEPELPITTDRNIVDFIKTIPHEIYKYAQDDVTLMVILLFNISKCVARELDGKTVDPFSSQLYLKKIHFAACESLDIATHFRIFIQNNDNLVDDQKLGDFISGMPVSEYLNAAMDIFRKEAYPESLYVNDYDRGMRQPIPPQTNYHMGDIANIINLNFQNNASMMTIIWQLLIFMLLKNIEVRPRIPYYEGSRIIKYDVGDWYPYYDVQSCLQLANMHWAAARNFLSSMDTLSDSEDEGIEAEPDEKLPVLRGRHLENPTPT